MERVTADPIRKNGLLIYKHNSIESNGNPNDDICNPLLTIFVYALCMAFYIPSHSFGSSNICSVNDPFRSVQEPFGSVLYTTIDSAHQLFGLVQEPFFFGAVNLPWFRTRNI
jgi:hypothetical protein